MIVQNALNDRCDCISRLSATFPYRTNKTSWCPVYYPTVFTNHGNHIVNNVISVIGKHSWIRQRTPFVLFQRKLPCFYRLCCSHWLMFISALWCSLHQNMLMAALCGGMLLSKVRQQVGKCMMTSSNGNIFRVTGHLCGEFTGSRWIPLTNASDADLWCLLWSAYE